MSRNHRVNFFSLSAHWSRFARNRWSIGDT